MSIIYNNYLKNFTFVQLVVFEIYKSERVVFSFVLLD